MVTRTLRLGLAALAGVAMLTPLAASAQYYGAPPAYQGRGYAPPPPRDDRGYADGRRAYRGRCRNPGTTGTILGAIAGGLLGNAAGGRGNRGAGTVIGAGAGALAGRAVDRDC